MKGCCDERGWRKKIDFLKKASQKKKSKFNPKFSTSSLSTDTLVTRNCWYSLFWFCFVHIVEVIFREIFL